MEGNFKWHMSKFALAKETILSNTMPSNENIVKKIFKENFTLILKENYMFLYYDYLSYITTQFILGKS